MLEQITCNDLLRVSSVAGANYSEHIMSKVTHNIKTFPCLVVRRLYSLPRRLFHENGLLLFYFTPDRGQILTSKNEVVLLMSLIIATKHEHNATTCYKYV